MNIKYKLLETTQEAKLTSEFLLHADNFGNIISDNERDLINSEPLSSLTNEKQNFWSAYNSNHEIVGTIGVKENAVGTNGYYLNWFAVAIKYRSQGIGKKLLKIVEDYLKKEKARYLTIETGDNYKYKRARKFYESAGFTQVAHIPKYYHPNCGRIDYYKEFTY